LSDRGEQLGVMSIQEARVKAQEEGVDLVEISPSAKPPVVKLIDYGKYKYQQQKKLAEAKKKQVVIQVKEIKLRPNIEKHDVEVKLKQIAGFFDDGDKVKLMMQFRGREMAHKDIGMAKFEDIIKKIVEIGGIVEAPLIFMGNRAIVLIAPPAKKK
jgi:translation initiation factor IF-3